ncbi:hypothetical protein Nepgr_000414 [Nepenthes gracilis]|uniref:Uncharacterized protein n=1 Tax=Nepenthes gracilis TaxID=150966 RepID=A0AAD3P1S0_NEPGR|nr:hypothetical protein Nepgr_000414 [Nepenthes gracilis]
MDLLLSECLFHCEAMTGTLPENSICNTVPPIALDDACRAYGEEKLGKTIRSQCRPKRGKRVRDDGLANGVGDGQTGFDNVQNWPPRM